jgi:hypothetical protein
MYFSCQKREKKEKIQTLNHRRQSNHDISTRAILYGRGHDCAFNDAMNGQIWPLESVSHASLMVRAPPTYWGMWNTR